MNRQVYFCFAVRAHDKRIACEEEFSDSENEAEGQGGGRRNAANHKKAKRVKKEEEKEGEEKKGEARTNEQLFRDGKIVTLTGFVWLLEVKEEEKEEEKMDTSG